ncbi:MAG: radical SAM protein [Clostridiales bacterium]|nr:radical SAM protein [Clostridiales bacterium]
MKVVLVNPRSGKNMIPLIPIGLLYLASELVASGHMCEIVDLNYDDLKKFEKKINYIEPELIGVSIRNIAETEGMNRVYIDIKPIIEVARKYSKIVLGGAGFSIFPRTIMKLYNVDYGIVGPGEAAIRYIANKISEIPNGTMISMVNEGFIKSDISVAMENYWSQYGKYHIVCNNSLPIQTTRGCKYNCRYCTYSNISNHFMQQRPIESVISEMKRLKSITKMDRFYFVDSVFNMDLSYMKKLLHAIIDNDIRCKWQSCINPVEYDDELIGLMKKSGCEFCEIGVDSFSDAQLNSFGKSFNSKQAQNLIRRIEQADINYSVSLILGGYGETNETLIETWRIAEESIGTKINAFVGERIYPNTKLADILNIESEEELSMASDTSIYLSKDVSKWLLEKLLNSSSDKWSFVGRIKRRR